MVVVHDERRLGLVVAGPHVVARHADDVVAEQRDECHVHELVDIRQPGDLTRRQRGHRAEVTEVDALPRLTAVERLDEIGVVGVDRPDVDRPAVGQGDVGLPPIGIGELAHSHAAETTGGRGSCEDEPRPIARGKKASMIAVEDTPTTDETHYRTCPLCEASCGLELTVRDGKVVRVRGDRDNPFSRGFICPKGSALQRIHEDPDRLRRPLVRRGDDPATATWEEVSWSEAFAEIERGLLPIIEAHGRDAVGVYLGNPNAHTLAGVLYVRPLLHALGTKNLFSASTVDQMPKHVSSGLLFGNALAIPVPDLDRTHYLLMLGANPWESNGSLCTAPDFPGRLKAIQERGGRFVVVDPRRTRTAEEADEHVAIRPGTDAQLLLAMINVLFADELVSLGHLERFDERRRRSPLAVTTVHTRSGGARVRRRCRDHSPAHP